MPTSHRSYPLLVAIVASFLAVAVFAIITYINTVAVLESDQVVARSYAVREATRQLMSAMKDAQTGQRGFLLTGDPEYLAPYEIGTAEAAKNFAELKALTSDDEVARIKVGLLEESLRKQQAHLVATIAERRKLPNVRVSDEVLGMVQTGQGRAAMKLARTAVTSIVETEEEKLAESDLRTLRRTELSRTTITIGNLIVLGLISLSGIAVVVDRRKRDKAEWELLKQQNEMEAIIESAFEGIITFGDDLSIRYMNRAATAILRGVSADTNDQGRGIVLDLVPTNQRDEIKRQLDIFRSSELDEQRFQSLVMMRTDGSEFACDGSIVRTTAYEEQFTTFKFHDVTETELLKTRHREYAAILGQVQEAIVVCALNDTIQSWNQGAQTLFGITEDDAIGRDIGELLFQGRMEQWRSGSKTLMSVGTFHVEFAHVTPDGREVVIQKRRSLIRGDDHQPTAQLLLMIDVTDRVSQEAYERRSQRLESIGTLAGGVAHDLNNVLTPIIMSAKLLKRGSDTPERLMDNIVTSAQRGAKMIEKLLAFAGGNKSDRRKVDVREILSELEELLSHTLPQDIDLQVTIPKRLRKIKADSTELSQVVMNLAINARDAMPDGGRLEIGVTDFQVDHSRAVRSDKLSVGPYVLLTVSDTGEGIPENIIDRIFDPFFTTKAMGKGTGLGLATTIGIVRSCGGDITVYSEPGTGTTFSVLLPTLKLTAKAQAKSDLNHGDVPLGNGETILIVDDEMMILRTAQETLESSNYRVLTAAGGTDAVAIFQHENQRIDLVLLDMMMPGMDGSQTKNAMRTLNADSKILASSGLRRPLQEGGKLSDRDGFLPKPYSNETLLRAVREILDKN